MVSQQSEHIIHTDYSRPFRRVMSASTLMKDSVYNRMNENLGSIKDIMIDLSSGRIAYAVLSVGGFLGMGDRLFAIPWELLTLDEDRQCFIMDVDKQRLEKAPGFDKSNWPDMADTSWGREVYKYWTGRDDYGVNAAMQYDRGVSSQSDAEIERAAREARAAVDGPESADLRRAEEIGKQPLRR